MLFFYEWKVLCLHGGREHKALKLSQFTFHSDGKTKYVTGPRKRDLMAGVIKIEISS